jgi:peptidoglycan/xylan/chitin deacetylase (PgdA/CDA1 family)
MFSSRLARSAAILLTLALAAPQAYAACSDPSGGLGVERIVEIDAASGPLFGALSGQEREPRFLRPKEVVLTFDDGPMPAVTRPILDTLDRFCTKATFFTVGRMAVAYPAMLREVMDRGHTLGTHTWSHPLNLPRIGFDKARDQIESGFAAAALAAGRPIAPFFRFPGLSDSPALLTHLQERGIAAFTVDVVSNDSYISDPGRLIARTLERAEAEKGGIILFHDIKHVTARALPTILSELKKRGFKVVHLRAKTPFVPDEKYMTAVREQAQRTTRNSPLLAITNQDSTAPSPAASATIAAAGSIPVEHLAPAPRDRNARGNGRVIASRSGASEAPLKLDDEPRSASHARTSPTPRIQAPVATAPPAQPASRGWMTTFRRQVNDTGG